jgi:SNF2-related domain/HSA
MPAIGSDIEDFSEAEASQDERVEHGDSDSDFGDSPSRSAASSLPTSRSAAREGGSGRGGKGRGKAAAGARGRGRGRGRGKGRGETGSEGAALKGFGRGKLKLYEGDHAGAIAAAATDAPHRALKRSKPGSLAQDVEFTDSDNGAEQPPPRKRYVMGRGHRSAVVVAAAAAAASPAGLQELQPLPPLPLPPVSDARVAAMVTRCLKQPMPTSKADVKRDAVSAKLKALTGGSQKANVVGEACEEAREPLHWRSLLKEMVWMAEDFQKERVRNKSALRKLSKSLGMYFRNSEARAARKEREEMANTRRTASKVAREVRQFWGKLNRIVAFKQKLEADELRRKAMDKHLVFLVKQTERYTTMLASQMHEGGVLASEVELFGGAGSSAAGAGAASSAEAGHSGSAAAESSRAERLARRAALLLEQGDVPADSASADEHDDAMSVASDGTAESTAAAAAAALTTAGDAAAASGSSATAGDAAAVVAVEQDDDDDEYQLDNDEPDDETTMEAEEQLGGGPNAAQELSELQGDAELSVEELMAKYYGGSKGAADDDDAADSDADDGYPSDSSAIEEAATTAEAAPSIAQSTAAAGATAVTAVTTDAAAADSTAVTADAAAAAVDMVGDIVVSETYEIPDSQTAAAKAAAAAATAAGDAAVITAADEHDDDDEYQLDNDEPDDETTMEAEEQLGGGPNAAQELSELQGDAELSVEELMAKYYGGSSGATADDDEAEGSSADDDAESIGSDYTPQRSSSAAMDVDSDADVADTAAAADEEHDDDDDDGGDADATSALLRLTAADDAARSIKVPRPFLLSSGVRLREYQHVGLNWLVSLHERRLNGILADEMGLGKTIQTIALLAYLACFKGIWGPHLIIVPTSCIVNWETELKRFCPGFKVLTYYGSAKRRRDLRSGWTKPNTFHVVVTSYQLAVQDASSFKRKRWYHLILDEAHNIKNFKSQRWQTLLTFNR